jgi:predicted nucleic acid-binding protein
MTIRPVVINTGPLITLSRIDALDIAGELPFEFMAPRAVRQELDEGTSIGYPEIVPTWLSIEEITESPGFINLATLGAGEAEVIQLALERDISNVCIDESKGRRVAAVAGLKVSGVLGLLGRAKKLGIISAVRPFIEKATAEGIRYHDKLIETVLNALDEN